MASSAGSGEQDLMLAGGYGHDATRPVSVSLFEQFESGNPPGRFSCLINIWYAAGTQILRAKESQDRRYHEAFTTPPLQDTAAFINIASKFFTLQGTQQSAIR